MVERSPKRKERSLLIDAGLTLASLVVLGGISTMASSTDRRRGVVERSGGKCENCGVSITNDETIVGHLDHSRRKNGRYNSDSNVKAHCFSCEAEFHLIHVGRSKDIGLSEENNIAVVLGRLIELLRDNPEKFINLFNEHHFFIDDDLFLRLYFEDPGLMKETFIDVGVDLPIDPYESLADMADVSEYDFMLFYFRRIDAVDRFLKDEQLEMPIDLISSLERLVEENLEEFLKLYFGHRRKMTAIFRDAGAEMPDLESILTKLSVEDNGELVRLIGEVPIIFETVDPGLIQDVPS